MAVNMNQIEALGEIAQETQKLISILHYIRDIPDDIKLIVTSDDDASRLFAKLADAELLMNMVSKGYAKLFDLVAEAMDTYYRPILTDPNAKGKTKKLPYGSCAYSKKTGFLQISNWDEAFKYAKENLPDAIYNHEELTDVGAAIGRLKTLEPTLVRTLEQLSPTAYIEAAENSGEMLPGLVRIPTEEVCKINGKQWKRPIVKADQEQPASEPSADAPAPVEEITEIAETPKGDQVDTGNPFMD